MTSKKILIASIQQKGFDDGMIANPTHVACDNLNNIVRLKMLLTLVCSAFALCKSFSVLHQFVVDGWRRFECFPDKHNMKVELANMSRPEIKPIFEYPHNI
jgi:hypothetical protein